DHAIEPRVIDHLDDGRHAPSFLSHHARPRTGELDLARGIRAVAELVLQALQVEAVARTVWAPARQQEARQHALGLREHEEGIRHRRRAEPYVPDHLVYGS